MKKILILLFVIIIGYIGGTKYYENASITNVSEYHKMYDEYFKPRKEGIAYPEFTSEYYQLWVRNYESIKEYTYAKTQKEYLKDKLRYYDEIAFKHKAYIHFLIQDVEQQLQTISDDEPSVRNEFFEKNRELYLKIVQQYLPSAEKMALFNEEELIKDKNVVVTNKYFNTFKEIVNDIRTTQEAHKMLPSMLFILDGGNGKEVPLDDYETSIFLKLIQKSNDEKKEKRSSQLYQAMIAFQIEEQDFYFHQGLKSLETYVEFLKTTSLDMKSELKSLISLIQSLKRSDSFEDDIQEQEACINKINSMIQI